MKKKKKEKGTMKFKVPKAMKKRLTIKLSKI